ncbi:DUF4348 domain-containing protein [Prevotella sp. kh1p2]|uniref:DUF4348 domain-containing protein n=1 Tax=Prevotella sp. kh1p2 TaxID=1761883 RepID=UPI0008C48A63|nr:DUF4348 domain-containing protein [Prevotella sp. kh1p2]SES96114.1 protein of unknown function [Prevotella sp. kh1p2]SNU11322.1 protein of unknown function [Prevotellaceae bacterium KH2P17]
MKKGAFFILFLVACTAISYTTTGCTDKKPAADSVAVDTGRVDSVVEDTMETIIEQTPMPKAADELFDDFFFNFCGNRKLQRSRIRYPLPVYMDGKVSSHIAQKEWKIDHFFMNQGYYTLIFDNRKQMNLMKDTAVNHVVVEKIYFSQKRVKQYLFNRVNGQWMLTSLNFKPMYENQNASFWRFYERFSTDSAFQVESMNDLVQFTTTDPDDEFRQIEGSMAPEQWPSFKPGLIPSGIIYNIIYGQEYQQSSQKIFVIRGIANGQEEELVFRKRQGRWKLMSFNG